MQSDISPSIESAEPVTANVVGHDDEISLLTDDAPAVTEHAASTVIAAHPADPVVLEDTVDAVVTDDTAGAVAEEIVVVPEVETTPAPVASPAVSTEASTSQADESAGAEVEADADPPETTASDTTTVDVPAAEPTEESPAATQADQSPALVQPAAAGLPSGQIVVGTVLSVDATEVVVDLGEGRLGVIGRRHLSVDGKADPTTIVAAGDQIEGAVLVREDRENRVVLSHTWAVKQRSWHALDESRATGKPVSATVVEVVKGGVTVDVGVRAFLPASHLEAHHVNDLTSYVGQQFDVLVVDADRVTDKVVVSRRNWLRVLERRNAAVVAATLEVGQIRKGRIITITDFGAFVDLGGVRGLLHLSELSWGRVDHPNDVLKVGAEVDVKIIGVKGGTKRISLSMRAVDPDPLDGLLEGQTLIGTVTRLVDFGAFVRVSDGVEGLVHVTELAEYRVHLPEEVVTPGDEVWVKVLRIDRKRRRVDLSVNQAVQV